MNKAQEQAINLIQNEKDPNERRRLENMYFGLLYGSDGLDVITQTETEDIEYEEIETKILR